MVNPMAGVAVTRMPPTEYVLSGWSSTCCRVLISPSRSAKRGIHGSRSCTASWSVDACRNGESAARCPFSSTTRFVAPWTTSQSIKHHDGPATNCKSGMMKQVRNPLNAWKTETKNSIGKLHSSFIARYYLKSMIDGLSSEEKPVARTWSIRHIDRRITDRDGEKTCLNRPTHRLTNFNLRLETARCEIGELSAYSRTRLRVLEPVESDSTSGILVRCAWASIPSRSITRA